MSIHKTEAIVLRTYEVRESSLIATFYTRSLGKVQCLAKGMRRTPNRFACHLAPLTHNRIVFYHRPQRGVHTLAEAELIDNFSGLARSPAKLAVAAYFSELVEELTRLEDENEDIFVLLSMSISLLREGKPPAALSRLFEIRMLELSGFMPKLDSCSGCGRHFHGEKTFSVLSGGILCPRCRSRHPESRPISGGTLASLRHLAGGEIARALELKMLPGIERELKKTLREFIEVRIEKNLKSVEFLGKLSDARREPRSAAGTDFRPAGPAGRGV